MSIHRLLVPTVLAAVAAGCINSATLISVKADGSGTVEQTLLVNAAATKMLGGLEQPGASGGPEVNEADLRRAAERMGGVRFVSAEPVTRGGFEGVTAHYAFDDISAVQVSQAPAMGDGSAGIPSPAAASPVRFRWARGATSSVLTVEFDETSTEPADDPDVADAMEMPDPQMLGMMKTMFQGFKIAIDLEVEGTIVKTNADWVTGSRVTLLEMDLSALLDDQAKLAEIQRSLGPDATFAAVRPLLRNVKGIKVNQPVVTIEYR